MTQAYRFDMVINTDIEMSDDLLCELCLEMRAAFLSLLKAKRIGGRLDGDIDISKAHKGLDGTYRTFTGVYIEGDK